MLKFKNLCNCGAGHLRRRPCGSPASLRALVLGLLTFTHLIAQRQAAPRS